MEGQALINDPMDHFSEGACLQRWLLPDASTGQGPGTLARKLSRCKEGMACVFAVRVQILLSITRVAVQVRSKPVNYHGIRFLLGALAQCRGTSCLGARNLSRCRILIGSRCGCPGAYTIT